MDNTGSSELEENGFKRDLLAKNRLLKRKHTVEIGVIRDNSAY